MAVAGDIIILEDWLQVDALVLDSRLVFLQNCLNFLSVLLSSKVLSAGK